MPTPNLQSQPGNIIFYLLFMGCTPLAQISHLKKQTKKDTGQETTAHRPNPTKHRFTGIRLRIAYACFHTTMAKHLR